MENKTKPNIILIILDSARAEAFSCYGNKLPTTPNIDKIAKEGILFKNAYSPASWTIPAHASLFTGTYWSTHNVENRNVEGKKMSKINYISSLNKENYETIIGSSNILLYSSKIAETFKKNINKRVSFNKINKINSKLEKLTFKEMENIKPFLFKSIFSLNLKDSIKYSKIFILKFYLWLLFLKKRLEKRDKRETKICINETIKKLNKLKKTNKPIFLFLNLMTTHYNYGHKLKHFKNLNFKNFFKIKFNRKLLQRNIEFKNPSKINKREISKKLMKKYYASINNADEKIGKIYDKLKKENLLDNTIFILTADHGDEFFEHEDLIFHGNCVYNNMIKIPLIMKFPDSFKLKGLEDKPVTLLDIFPTIFKKCNLNGIKSEGADIFSTKRKEIFSENMQQRTNKQYKIGKCIISKKFKYIKNDFSNDELYDIEIDPSERINLIKKYPKIAEKMKKDLVKWEKRKKQKIETMELDNLEKKELNKTLKSLGYI